MIINCLICLKEFDKKFSSQKYCSKECANISDTERIKKKNNGKGKGWSRGIKYAAREKCIICGKEFYCPPAQKKRSSNAGKFCSRTCYGKFMSFKYEKKFQNLREQRKIEKDLKDKAKEEKKKKYNKCKHCGKLTKTIFCDRVCYHNYKHERIGMNNIKKNCLTCGKEITVTPGQVNIGYGIYCSTKCAAINIRKTNTNAYQNSKGGKREDLNNLYFRSRWEANFARYLVFLQDNNLIKKWEYEPDTFVFDKITKGIRSYLPDFKVVDNNGQIIYYEIKGYMDDKSKIKLKRMAKYFPEVKLEVIDKPRYMELHKKLKGIIPGWEIDDNKKHLYK